MVETLGATERRACRVIGQHRSTQRKPRVPRQDEDVLTAAIIALAERFGLPVHYLGVGEGVDDLRPFKAADFARSLLGTT